MSDIRKAIMERLGEFARFGEKAEMANHIRTVAEDKEASRRGLRRMIDQLESEWQSLNNQPSKAGRIPRMETIKKQIAGLEERLKSLSSRPGAKAKMDKSAALAIVGKAVSSVSAGPQRDALQKALIDYYDNTQASKRLLQQGKLTDATRFDVEAGRAVQIAIRVWDRMGKPAAELRGYTQNLERAAEFSRLGAKATAAKPDETEREDVKAGLKLMEKADQAVSDKIRTLIKEGKPQDQAVAIALDMKRRGEL